MNPKPLEHRHPEIENTASFIDVSTPFAAAEKRLAGEGFVPPRIPGYEVLGILGKGGAGIVFRARQTALNRVVALKMMLDSGLEGELERGRFRAEAEAAAALRHANLVQVYEVSEINGRPFCAMEFVEGGSLAQRLSGQPQPSGEAAALVETIARAVQAAHEAGIVHRDLKPANILLTADGQPKIADFGLVKRIGSHSGLTQTGAILGTPSYMAPEQASGRSDETGPAADIYSLGAILYELLTGRPPFRGATILDTLRQVREQEPLAPSRLIPRLERDLETICLKCLEKSGDRRYKSAAALADELRRFIEGRPIAARPIGRRERLVKWTKREPRLAALSATLLAVILTALGIASWQLTITRRANRQLAAALVNEKEATRREERSRQEAQHQTALKEAELERAEQALYVQRIAQAHREWELSDYGRAQQILAECAPHRRGREWHFLNRQTQRTELEYANHSDAHCVDFLPGGQWLMTQRDPIATLLGPQPAARVCVWERATGKELLDVRADVGTYAPDGQTAAFIVPTGEPHRTRVQLFDIGSGQRIRTFAEDLSDGAAIHFGPRGETLVAVDQKATVRCWRVADGALQFTFQSKAEVLSHGFTAGGWARQVVFSSDGRRLVLNSGELLDSTTGTLIANVGGLRNAAFRPDGERLAIVGHSLILKMLHAATGQVAFELPAPEGRRGFVSKLQFSPDGKLLATCSGGINAKSGLLGQVRIYDSETGDEVRGFTPGSNAVTSLAFSPDGRLLAVGGDNGQVQLREVATTRTTCTFLIALHHAVTDIDFSPDGQILACAASQTAAVTLMNNAQIHLWNIGQVGLREFTFPNGKESLAQTGDVAFRELGQRSQLQFSRATEQLEWHLKHVPGGVQTCTFPTMTAPAARTPQITTREVPQRRFVIVGRSRDDRGLMHPGRLVIADGDGETGVMPEGPWHIWRSELSEDGQRLAATLGRALSWFGTPPLGYAVKVWDLPSGKEIFSIEGENTVANQLVISPDGRYLAFHARSENLQVWDIDHRRLVHDFAVSNAPQTLYFSPCGRRLVAGDSEGSIILWRLDEKHPPLHLRGHQGKSTCFAFDSNLSRLVSGGEDLMVRVWDTDSGQELLHLPGPGEALLHVLLSEDGDMLAVADESARLNLWDLRPLADPPFPIWPPGLAERDAPPAPGLP